MQISNQSLLAEMNTMAVEAGASPGNLTPTATSGSNFDDLLTNAINHVNHLQKSSSDLATRFEMGDSTVTLSDTMIAKEKSSVAFEATIQVRNKLVDSYKEIMSMPV
ncbi:flagellar hook-basal body complex protein FliE [Ferrimonas lipolytica]|uniref:Flagellar hook-basal body complex protein FliE n=1 Tax=Ferrimonas lipolytica TaxID=2724191 RepID=A0A6H1UE22_9GAMM|nr:flagellar hook-basal body complex protein FliE [Ferrimonas lipolytica]QIZ77357.1 flagellar hook-basal body complex protein FliE [Ferrimonas lipolytica]